MQICKTLGTFRQLLASFFNHLPSPPGIVAEAAGTDWESPFSGTASDPSRQSERTALPLCPPRCLTDSQTPRNRCRSRSPVRTDQGHKTVQSKGICPICHRAPTLAKFQYIAMFSPIFYYKEKRYLPFIHSVQDAGHS